MQRMIWDGCCPQHPPIQQPTVGISPAPCPPSPEFGFLPQARNRRRARAAARRIAYSSEEEEEVPPETSKKNSKWREREPVCLKYVDDNLQINRVNMETALRGYTEEGKNARRKHAVECQNSFRYVVRRAEERGMKVNAAKTAMVCVSGAQSYEAHSYIKDSEGTEICSGGSMKVLGFHLSSRPTVHAHVNALCKRMRRQYWVLYNLRKAGFDDDELPRVYRTCLLPILDYCSVVYHSSLTDDQDQKIERLQAGALRCIYGYTVAYSLMREKAGVTTLRERRVVACDKFAEKCASGRFSDWFPRREAGRRGARNSEVYLEEYARCNRLRDSPLFFMRRRMNGKEGKRYGERNKDYRDSAKAGSTSGRHSTVMNPARGARKKKKMTDNI